MIATLLKELKQYTRPAIMTPIWTSLSVAMGTLIPYATSFIIDDGIMAGDLGKVLSWGGVMLIITILNLLFGIRSGYTGAYASSGLAANLRRAMYQNIQRLSFSGIDRFSTASLITRMTTDVENIQNAFQMLLRISVRAPMTIITCMVMCMMINLRLSLIFLVAIIILTLSLTLIISRCVRLFNEMLKKFDLLNAVVRENVSGIRVVKSFVRENHESLKFRLATDIIYRLSVGVEMLMTLNMPVMDLVIYGCMIALSWFGARMIVMDGSITTGQLTALFSYVMAVLMSLMMLSFIFVQLTMSLASLKRVAEVIEAQPDMKEEEQPLDNLKDGSIEFTQVGFSYQQGGERVLENINLRIESGEKIGIIGATGSGKTTLASLISRLYDVSEGSVLVGGQDVRRYSLEALRSQVSTILQKSVLFRGSVLENLRWGKEDATLEECREACRHASCDDFIMAMPEGYDSHIEQGGSNLSGGQKQRLAIARGLLRRPLVLILDDSTSAVDTRTDASIRETFQKELPGTTILVIAQRVLSVMHLDRIIVMDQGRITDIGTHEQLLQSSVIYREIYEMQTSEGEADFDA